MSVYPYGTSFCKLLEPVSLAEGVGRKRGRDPSRLLPGAALIIATLFSRLPGIPDPVSSVLRGAMGFVVSKAMNDSLKGQQEFMRVQVTERRRRCRGSSPAARCLLRAGLAASPAELCSLLPGLKVLHLTVPPVPLWLPSAAGSGVSKDFLNSLP